MIKFFRKIRQQLLSDNKFSKYLMYAAGEIILVVVGILIALQINNWNERRKQQMVLNQYYELLLNDFDESKHYIHSEITALKEGIASFENYVNEFENENLEIDHFIDILDSIDNVTTYLKFENPTIQTLQNTGDIKLLPPTLRDKILILNGNQERWTIVNNSNNEVYLKQQMKAIALGLKTNIKTRTKNHPKIQKELQNYLNSGQQLLEAEAAYGLKYFTETHLLKEMNQMILDINEIEDLIKNELSID